MQYPTMPTIGVWGDKFLSDNHERQKHRLDLNRLQRVEIYVAHSSPNNHSTLGSKGEAINKQGGTVFVPELCEDDGGSSGNEEDAERTFKNIIIEPYNGNIILDIRVFNYGTSMTS